MVVMREKRGRWEIEFLLSEVKRTSQESALIIMHFQHANRYALVLENFSFLPHILQQCDKVGSCFFVLKNMLLFVAVAVDIL
jgi:hypothetical protein